MISTKHQYELLCYQETKPKQLEQDQKGFLRNQNTYLIKRIFFLEDVDNSDWRSPPSVLLMGGEEGDVGRALHLAAVSVAGADLEGLLEAVS